MGVKQFLKQDRRKIVICVILFSITSFYSLLPEWCGPTRSGGPCTRTYLIIPAGLCGMRIEDIGIITILLGIIMALIIPSLFLIRLFESYRLDLLLPRTLYYQLNLDLLNIKSLILSLFLITNLIYQYFLSCLIIWIYDEYRKKKK